MPRNARTLLVTWDGAGNLPPELSLVDELVAQGHTVHALAHDSLRETLERHGVACLRLRGARPYDSKQPMAPAEEMPFVIEHVWYGEAFGSELLESVEQLRPDLLLVDANLTYALVAARSTGIPTVVLCHIPYSLMLGPLPPSSSRACRRPTPTPRSSGSRRFPSHQALIEAAQSVLVASYRAFDGPPAMAANVVHVGPCRKRSDGAATWRRSEPHRPLVVVGMSTSHQHQLPMLQRLCDALGNLDVEALVTTGPAISPDLLRASTNTTVARFVFHDDVLPAADLLVTHAGHGTAMAGVTYGVPMLCFPMGRDQPLIANRVVELGIGSARSPEASVADIEEAIRAMLADTGIRDRAARFAATLADHSTLEDAARIVDELLASPRTRPAR